MKITNVESRSGGMIVIQSENCEDRENVKSPIQLKISKQYEVKIPNWMGLNINIIGMSFDYSKNDLIEKWGKQNSKLTDAN